MDKWGWKVRTIILLVGIAIFVMALSYRCIIEAHTEYVSMDKSFLWPPDMVPHPDLPAPQPDDRMS